MVVWDGLRKLNGYQGSDVRCLNRCVMEAICQRNLPEPNIAVLMVKAIYFMPGDLGSRTLRIAYPSNGVPLGSRTLWEHLGSRILGIEYPSNGERGLVVRQEYLLKKLAKYITSPSSWRSRSISYPGPWNGVRGPDVRQHSLLKRLVKVPEHRCSNS